MTGALGSVGRAAVHTAKKIGAQAIAGFTGKRWMTHAPSQSLTFSAIDNDNAIENFRLVDAIVDTVGGYVAAKLIAKVRQNGCLLYTSPSPRDTR